MSSAVHAESKVIDTAFSSVSTEYTGSSLSFSAEGDKEATRKRVKENNANKIQENLYLSKTKIFKKITPRKILCGV